MNPFEILFIRYFTMAASNELFEDTERCSSKAIRALCQYAIENYPIMDEGKLNRWLGFVQGILIAAGVTTVDIERDFSRPLFNPSGCLPTIDVL